MLGYIYRAISPSGKIYYGKTIQTLEKRKGGHLRASETDRLLTNHFLSAIRKYGIDNFEWAIVETLDFDSKKELINLLNEREKYWITSQHTYDRNIGYNMTLGGDGGAVKGRILSEETKKKISNSLKGKNYTKERRENMSKNSKGVSRPKKDTFSPWCKGKELPDETKEKISKARKGKKFTEEHKKKLSESRKGKIPWNKGKKSAVSDDI